MKFSIRDENGDLKPEIKIGMALDDYKLKNKEDWWRKCLKKIPSVTANYDFVREEIGAGVTANTVMCYRFYKLKQLEATSGEGS